MIEDISKHQDELAERFRELATRGVELLDAGEVDAVDGISDESGRILHEVRCVAAARQFLKSEKADELAAHPRAIPELVRDMLEVDAARDVIDGDPPPDLGPAVDGVHPLDEQWARALVKIGKTGEEMAKAVRAGSKARSAEESLARWRTSSLVGPNLHRFTMPLAKALWRDRVRERVERRAKIPAPTLHPAVSHVALLTPVAASMTTREDGSLLVKHDLGSTLVQKQALVSVAIGTEALRAGDSGKLRLVVTLAAWLTMKAHERWLALESRFDFVPMPTGRDSLRAAFNIDGIGEADVEASLAWLQDMKIGGAPCVYTSWPEEQERTTKGGRPAKSRVVHVGPALAPQGLAGVFKQAGVKLPKPYRFFAPVLNPADAPLRGDKRSRLRQRDMYSMGLGLFLTRRRDEYRDYKGVKIDTTTWRREATANGLYHRSHKSLADDILEAYVDPTPRLFGPPGPVLVETEPGSERYKLGPGYAAQEQVILNAGELSAAMRGEGGEGDG